MAFPRFLAVLLLCVVLADWPVQAQILEGSYDVEEAACNEDQDDTGLMQAPGRKETKVTKVRGIVGSAKEGGASAALSLPVLPPSGKGANKQPVSVESVVAPANPSPLSMAAQKPPVVAQPLATGVSAEDNSLLLKAADAGRGTDSTSVASSVSTAVVQTSKKADPGASGEAGGGPLAFFQVDQVEGDEVNQDEEQPTEVVVESQEGAEQVAEKEGADVDATEDQKDKLEEEEAVGADLDDANVNIVTAAAATPDDDIVLAPDAPDDGYWWLPDLSGMITANWVTVGQMLLLLIAFTLLMNFALRSRDRPRDALSAKMRRKLECMRVATGPEIRSVCSSDGVSGDKPQSPAALMRIQGRVVSKSIGPLTAPLSGRSCVLYSASVSQHRHDGVHQPPVAFDSSSRDFAVQLEDCPEMMLEINSQDAFPFDMDAGRYASELAFAEAPDAWRGFMLANLTPGVEGGGAKGQSMNRVDLGEKGPLNFRECALAVGSRVTCIGEVVREHNGKLRLCPWSPPPTDELAQKSRKMKWLEPEAEPWVHKLMISDDTRLLVEASPFELPAKCRSCTGTALY